MTPPETIRTNVGCDLDRAGCSNGVSERSESLMHDLVNTI